jgi:two-component system, NtrC family, response regulator AtoC
MQDGSDQDQRLTLTRQHQDTVSSTMSLVRTHVVVIEDTSCRIVELPTTGVVTIGRATDVELALVDPTVSRRHAELSCHNRAVSLIDLGSHNGTQVNGENVAAPRQLRPGDVITICKTQLVFQASGEVSSPVFGRRAHDLQAFRDQVKLEIDRAMTDGSRYDQRVATLMVVQFSMPRAVDDIVMALGANLLPIDLWYRESPSMLLLLRPENAAQDDDLDTFMGAIRTIDTTARVGWSLCPTDGIDVDVLLEGARSAAQLASPGTYRAAAAGVPGRMIGGQPVIVADPSMIRIYGLVDKLAASDIAVLINGETGAGKELIAAALHEGSPRRAAQWRELNCAALPETLAESELFGHARGAFSGAVSHKAGLFEAANGSTVFLDEVGELTLALQAKLLRAIETKRISRIGETESRPIDVRLVAATNRDLKDLIGQGKFREDLYYRIAAARISVPPLRDRPREIPALARQFLAAECAQLGRSNIAIDAAATAMLLGYRWPGNVRELKNTMKLLAGIVAECVLHAADVAAALEIDRPQRIGAVARSATPIVSDTTFRAIDEEIRELEIRRMREALAIAGGVKVRAAALISMPIRTFNTKFKLNGLG